MVNHCQIFTVDHLENQFHIFNLKKYARSKVINLFAQDLSFPTTPQASRQPSKTVSPGSYIPPHRRTPSIPPPSNPSPSSRSSLRLKRNKPISLSRKTIEASWDKCLKGGVFAIWNEPREEFPLLFDWLEEHCEEQVSISSYSDNTLFLQCANESIRKEFLLATNCFFNGHCVRFIEWSHNFNLELLDCYMPSWFVLPSLPPELCHEDIIEEIGLAIGEARGINASFYWCNDVKILINTKINHPIELNKKFISYKSSYEIKF